MRGRTAFNREGIQVGTAVSLLVRKRDTHRANEVRYRQFWGKNKRADLLLADTPYQRLRPVPELGLPFAPAQVEAAYLSWPLLPDLFPVSFPGVKTSRDDVVVDIDKERLINRMEQYFDPAVSNEEMRLISPAAMTDATRFQAEQTRDYLRKRGFMPENVVQFYYRPFDIRWLYWEPETKLLDEKRSQYFPHVDGKTFWLAATQQNRKDFNPPVITRHMASLHVIERGANVFPERLAQSPLLAEEEPHSNLSPRAIEHLAALGLNAEALFHHLVAVLHSPKYAQENGTPLRQDWPRIPLPATKDVLTGCAALGRQVAALLDSEQPVPSVTISAIRPELLPIGLVTTAFGKLDPDSGDLDITAGWGHTGNGGITMPGKGKLIQREYTAAERAAIGNLTSLLGATTYDTFLNNKVYWKNIPSAVWEYTLGGYQAEGYGCLGWTPVIEWDLCCQHWRALARALKVP